MDSDADGDGRERKLTVRLTLHSGSDTTARDDARERVESALEGIDGWRIEGSEIVEPPTAPFEPHTVEVTVAVGKVDAATPDDAEEALAAEGLEVVG